MARLLANENFPLHSVSSLRQLGHDVLAVTEVGPGMCDSDVLSLAHAERRILVTFDRDYGELVYRRNLPCPPTIIYLRFAPDHPEEPAQVVEELLRQGEANLTGYFIVQDREHARKRLLPGVDGMPCPPSS